MVGVDFDVGVEFDGECEIFGCFVDVDFDW